MRCDFVTISEKQCGGFSLDRRSVSDADNSFGDEQQGFAFFLLAHAQLRIPHLRVFTR
jgi:hypothetical protein